MEFDLKLFIFQLINFLIFWAVLHYALMKIFAVIKKRNKQIADDLDNAKKENEEAFRIKTDWEDKMKEANRQAGDIINTARKDAEAARTKDIERTKEEVKTMILQAKEQIESSRNEVVRELRTELASISGEIAMKFISDKIDPETAEKLVEEAIKSKGNLN